MTVHVQPSSVYPEEPAGSEPGGLPLWTRLTGTVVTAGTTAWITSLIIAGNGIRDKIVPIEVWGSMAFLFGALFLVALVLSTNATGRGKGRYIAIVEMALFVPALIWCPLEVAYDGDTPGWVIPFDMCWPLSMLGMLVLGIAVAKVGRYRGLLRWQLLLCGLWLPVAGVGQAVIGDDGGSVPGTVWLGLSYGVLGLRLAFTPRIVLPAPAPTAS